MQNTPATSSTAPRIRQAVRTANAKTAPPALPRAPLLHGLNRAVLWQLAACGTGLLLSAGQVYGGAAPFGLGLLLGCGNTYAPAAALGCLAGLLLFQPLDTALKLAGACIGALTARIVGRQLEHSRIFWFANGGEEQLYLSSADWMPRNLNYCVELFFPVETEEHIHRIKGLLDLYLRDNVGAHMMQSNGTYRRVHNKLEPVSAQATLYEMAQLAVTSDKLPMEQRLQPVFSRR